MKAHEIDQQYHITEKAQQVKTAVVEKSKQIDESYHITEKAQQVKTSVTSTAQSVANKAAENPTIKASLDTAKSYASSMAASASAYYKDYKEQTQKAIDEKRKAQGQTTTEPQGQQNNNNATQETATAPSTQPVTEGMANLSTQETSPKQ